MANPDKTPNVEYPREFQHLYAKEKKKKKNQNKTKLYRS